MAYNPNKNYVYKKDREGSTYKIGEIVFDNQIIQHPACLTNVCSTLKTLPKFPTRKDDIWIIAFPKSGQCFPFLSADSLMCCHTSLSK